MSMHEVNYYKYYAKDTVTPEWMRDERYEYCEPFFDRFSSAKSGKKSHMLIHSIFTAFTLFR